MLLRNLQIWRKFLEIFERWAVAVMRPRLNRNALNGAQRKGTQWFVVCFPLSRKPLKVCWYPSRKEDVLSGK